VLTGQSHADERWMTTASLSVVIPVYRGADTIEELVGRLGGLFAKGSAAFEVILVNDASPDESWATICRMAERYPWVRGIDLMKNAGQHNALLCGVRAARHEVIVTMDDDLQHPPEQVPALLEKLAEGYDLVYCTPCVEPRSAFRNLASRCAKHIILKYVARQDVEISSYRVFRSHVRCAFEHVTNPSIFFDLILSWGARTVGSLQLDHNVSKTGASSYSFTRLLWHALNMLTSYSVLPLHFASWIGFAVTGIGCAVLVFTLMSFLIQGRVVPGFAFLSSIIAIFSGAQLFSVGILGLYLARMYEGMMGRSAYVIRGRTPGDARVRETNTNVTE